MALEEILDECDRTNEFNFEKRPLLNTSSDIERPSHAWGEAPLSNDEYNTESSSDSSQRHSFIVEEIRKNETNKKKSRHFFETIIMVNLAQLLYVATISFTKGMILS